MANAQQAGEYGAEKRSRSRGTGDLYGVVLPSINPRSQVPPFFFDPTFALVGESPSLNRPDAPRGTLRKNKRFDAVVNRKFVADAVSMAIFWTVVYTPVFLYTSRSIEAALIGLGSSTVLEVMLGGVYGRFNDWFRGKAGVTR